MVVSPADASAALSDIAAAEARSITYRGYQSMSPHLMIWGVAYAIGYTVNDLAQDWVGPAWLAITAVAVTGDILAARSDRKASENGATTGALFCIILAFVGATLAVMQPHDPRQVGAFIPLVVAGAYAIIGLMGAPRMMVLGAALAALTLVGFFGLPAHFMLWMAAVGGGSLVLGGLWLRQV